MTLPYVTMSRIGCHRDRCAGKVPDIPNGLLRCPTRAEPIDTAGRASKLVGDWSRRAKACQRDQSLRLQTSSPPTGRTQTRSPGEPNLGAQTINYGK